MIRPRAYRSDSDFTTIRDFLSSGYQRFSCPLNWRIERWNYARYFIAPMLAHYGQAAPTDADAAGAIALWEDRIGVWERDGDEIVGVVNIEHPDPFHPGFGEAFLQRHPDHSALLEEMIVYAEERLTNPKTGSLHLYVYEYDQDLQAILARRGYRQDTERIAYESVRSLQDLPAMKLPSGYELCTMADRNDIDRRRKAFGLAFHHPDSAEWPSAYAYRSLQEAPDYRHDLDIYLVAPDEEFVAFCLVWYDAQNRLASLEPVGTHPDYRRKGLGRAVVLEGLRRAARLGATAAQVGSGQRFYESLGFTKKYASCRWHRQIFAFGRQVGDPGSGGSDL